MRTAKLFFFLLIISFKSLGQSSFWKKNVFNEFLTLNLPTAAKYDKSSYLRAFGGDINANYYGFQYYDTIFKPITTEKQFQISLTGYISGRVSDPALKRYNVMVADTSIGETKGLMARFITSDTSETYKQIYFYVTIANNHYYLFYVYSPLLKNNDEEINFFFKSIIFDSKKLKEISFTLTPVHLTKTAD
jgi:hypothetical protein